MEEMCGRDVRGICKGERCGGEMWGGVREMYERERDVGEM